MPAGSSRRTEPSERILAGARDHDPAEGRVIVEDGEIITVEPRPAKSTDIVRPAFVEAHTHVGDVVAKKAGRGRSPEEPVAPPGGRKHRRPEKATREETVAAMARTPSFMEAGGTAASVEFRENGVEGVGALTEAAADVDVEPVILGRGSADVLEVANGFGASGTLDDDFTGEGVTGDPAVSGALE